MGIYSNTFLRCRMSFYMPAMQTSDMTPYSSFFFVKHLIYIASRLQLVMIRSHLTTIIHFYLHFLSLGMKNIGSMVTNDTIHTWWQKNNVVVVKCERALLVDKHFSKYSQLLWEQTFFSQTVSGLRLCKFTEDYSCMLCQRPQSILWDPFRDTILMLYSRIG